jgi:cytochrome P450
VDLDAVDLTDLDRFASGFPHDVFTALRRERPVWFHPPTPHTPGSEGFWVLTRYDDIATAAAEPALSSARGGDRSGGGTLIEDLPFGFAAGVLPNMMDDPRHRRFRRLATPAVSPRTLREAPYNRRTAARALDLRGHTLRAGEKVTLWWASANRDERIFRDPFRFDLRRAPNPHLAFGHGPHFCLGATLARLEIRVMLDALLERCERIELDGAVEWTRSNKHTGLRHMPVILHART